MVCLSGFELYSRWVPLNDYLIKLQIDFCNAIQQLYQLLH